MTTDGDDRTRFVRGSDVERDYAEYQRQFDEKLGRALRSPVPTLMVLAGVGAFVLIAWLASRG